VNIDDDNDRVPPSSEVVTHRHQVEFREELDHISHLVSIAEVCALLTGVGIMFMVVAVAAILVLTYL
jgi:hypothetical protein